jgi:hypothetical protein
MSSAWQALLLMVVATIAMEASPNSSIAQDGTDAKSSQPLFIDQRRLPEGAKTPQPSSVENADEKQKTEEQKKLDDLAAKLKAEQDDLAAREAEARKKFEELKRLSDEADAKQKESDERLSAREAEAQKQVVEAKRLADEARNKLQEELQKQSAQKAVTGAIPSDTSSTPPPAQAGPDNQDPNTATQSAPRAALNVPAIALNCPEASITTDSLPGGRSKITVQSPCRRGQNVSLQYGPITTRRAFDDKGNVEFVADMFLGPAVKTNILFADGQPRSVRLSTGDLGEVTKVAIIWDAPVNLDLHAFEYAAMRGEPGDVWSGAPRDAAQAAALVSKDGRGHGFMSSADDGKSAGPKAEVFTFWQSKQQSRGAVGMVLDYETRGTEPQGEDCGNGRYAQIPIQVIERDANGSLSRQDGLISSVPCGKALSTEARYQTGVIPDIRIHNAR